MQQLISDIKMYIINVPDIQLKVGRVKVVLAEGYEDSWLFNYYYKFTQQAGGFMPAGKV